VEYFGCSRQDSLPDTDDAPITLIVSQKRRKISHIADTNKEIFPKARSFIQIFDMYGAKLAPLHPSFCFIHCLTSMIMKNWFLATLIISLSVSAISGQNKTVNNDIFVSSSVLSTAQWAGFKYREQLDLARQGDMRAVEEMLNFNGTVDGREGLDHAVTCLELIPYSSDLVFAAALNKGKPTLRKLMLERLPLAQGRTKVETLKKPLSEWAPLTWAVLNGQPFEPADTSSDECMMSRPKQQKEQEKAPTDTTPKEIKQ
jgi:hypothetical protein